MHLAIAGTAITVAAAALTLTVWYLAYRARGRNISFLDQAGPALLPSTVRLLRSDDDVATALERAATSERQLLARASRRYAHYQGHLTHPGTLSTQPRVVGQDVESHRPDATVTPITSAAQPDTTSDSQPAAS